LFPGRFPLPFVHIHVRFVTLRVTFTVVRCLRYHVYVVVTVVVRFVTFTYTFVSLLRLPHCLLFRSFVIVLRCWLCVRCALRSTLRLFVGCCSVVRLPFTFVCSVRLRFTFVLLLFVDLRCCFVVVYVPLRYVRCC
jgi:hypothetical protein